MAFTELEAKRVERGLAAFLKKRRPSAHLRSEVDISYRIDGQSVEIFEIRPRWNDPTVKVESPFAKTVFVRSRQAWKIYWRRADLKWHAYAPTPLVRTFDEFIAIVDEDESACFFG